MMFRKYRLFLIIFCLILITQLSFPQFLLNQGPVDVTGKVVCLDAPFTGVPFIISWHDGRGKIFTCMFDSLSGLHIYDIRLHPSWGGIACDISINNYNSIMRGEILQPSFFDEMKLFLQPEVFNQSRTNFFVGNTLFGLKWHYVLPIIYLLLIALLSILFIRKYKIINIILILSLAIFIWGDIKSDYDLCCGLYDINNNISENCFIDTNRRAKELSEVIGGKSWSEEQLIWPFREIVYYSLAKCKWQPEPKKADYIVYMKNLDVLIRDNK